jgi:hypothetical protein
MKLPAAAIELLCSAYKFATVQQHAFIAFANLQRAFCVVSVSVHL